MANKFVASTQYGDLKGTVAFDGHEGPPLDQLAELTDMTGEYFPVGVYFYRLNPDEDGKIPFEVVAVRCDKVGTTWDEVTQFAKQEEHIPVYGFSGRIALSEFDVFFKRIDIKALHFNLEHQKVVKDSTGT